MEEVLRRRCGLRLSSPMESLLRRFLAASLLLLRLLDGLRRRLLGGVALLLSLLLLLLVSRRSSRLRLPRLSSSMRSLFGSGDFRRRAGGGDRDLEIERVSDRLRALRDDASGDKL